MVFIFISEKFDFMDANFFAPLWLRIGKYMDVHNSPILRRNDLNFSSFHSFFLTRVSMARQHGTLEIFIFFCGMQLLSPPTIQQKSTVLSPQIRGTPPDPEKTEAWSRSVFLEGCTPTEDLLWNLFPNAEFVKPIMTEQGRFCLFVFGCFVGCLSQKMLHKKLRSKYFDELITGCVVNILLQSWFQSHFDYFQVFLGGGEVRKEGGSTKPVG